MKRFFFLTLFSFLLAALPLPGADALRRVQVRFSPAEPVVGEAVSVLITVDCPKSVSAFDFSGEVILPAVPRARWQKNLNGMQLSTTNGETRVTFQRVLIPEEAGKFSIPPIRVRFHGQEGESAPAELTVLPAGSASARQGRLSDQPLLKARFLRKGPFRPGETAELEIELTSPDRFSLDINAFPTLTRASGLRLLQLPYGEEANPAFRIHPLERGSGESGRYHRLRMTAKALFLLPGRWEPEVTLPVTFRMRDFFSPARTRTLTAQMEPFSVLPRPEVPAGVWDTGLLGKWNFTLTLTPQECRVGEGAELTLLARDPAGTGSAELFRPPEISVPGCRIYPPDVRRESGRITLRYALVPLQTGKREAVLRLAAYDPAKKRNLVTELPLAFSVKPGELPVPAALPASPAQAASPETESRLKNDPGSALFPWKPLAGRKLTFPLLHQTLFLSSLLGTAGIVLLFLSLFPFGKKRETGDRRSGRERRARLRMLRKKLSSSEDMTALFSGENLAAIAETLGLPGGTTAGELAETLPDPELRRFFAELSRSAFSPETQRALPVSDPLRKKLRKFLSTLLVMILLVSPVVLSAADPGEAYEKREFAQAEKLLSDQAKQGEISAAFCYDMGCVCYQQGKQEAALLWFTRASLLAPRDPQIRGNRELAELSLFPEGREKNISALHSFRDLLRPDHYFLLAGITLFLLGVILLLRNFLSRPVRWWGAGTLLFLLILWSAALCTQSLGPYSPRRLMLMGKRIELRAIPSSHAKTLEILSGGEEAELLESRPHWLLIRFGETSGWIPASEAERIYPYGLF